MVNFLLSKLPVGMKAQLTSPPRTLISLTVLTSSTPPSPLTLFQPHSLFAVLWVHLASSSTRTSALADPCWDHFFMDIIVKTLLKYQHLKKTCLHHPINNQNPFFFLFLLHIQLLSSWSTFHLSILFIMSLMCCLLLMEVCKGSIPCFIHLSLINSTT